MVLINFTIDLNTFKSQHFISLVNAFTLKFESAVIKIHSELVLAEESTTSATGAFVMDSDFVLVRGVEEPTDQSVN